MFPFKANIGITPSNAVCEILIHISWGWVDAYHIRVESKPVGGKTFLTTTPLI